MQRVLSISNFASSDLEVNPTFNVVIAYEDYEMGQQARRTYDFLLNNLGLDCRFESQIWKFDVLESQRLREEAAAEAAKADLFIIASRTGELPSGVTLWLESLLQKQPQAMALVVLFAKDCDPASTEFTQAYVADVARRGRMEFFIHPGNPTASVKPRSQVMHHAFTASEAVHDGGGPRWGINE